MSKRNFTAEEAIADILHFVDENYEDISEDDFDELMGDDIEVEDPGNLTNYKIYYISDYL